MLGAGETHKYDCEGMIGQYVTITIPGSARYLTLCEVQVFGVRVAPLSKYKPFPIEFSAGCSSCGGTLLSNHVHLPSCIQT